MIKFEDFERIEIRTGTIVEAELFDKAIKPAYKLKVDFGLIGIKNSSAQITFNYSLEELIGKQIVAVVNFPPKQIANFFSECLVLGVYKEDDNVVLLQPDRKLKNGLKIG